LLSFALWNLTQYPDTQKRLHEEIDRVLQGEACTAAHLEHLSYTRSVLNETLRLYPPVPNLERITTRPVELMGYQIPAGVALSMRFHAVHRDERYWSSPDTFDPDRWNTE